MTQSGKLDTIAPRFDAAGGKEEHKTYSVAAAFDYDGPFIPLDEGDAPFPASYPEIVAMRETLAVLAPRIAPVLEQLGGRMLSDGSKYCVWEDKRLNTTKIEISMPSTHANEQSILAIPGIEYITRDNGHVVHPDAATRAQRVKGAQKPGKQERNTP
jgi:hypothetical protein